MSEPTAQRKSAGGDGAASHVQLGGRALSLDKPGDRYEQEADAIARAAVGGNVPSEARASGRMGPAPSNAVPEPVLARVEPVLGADLGHVRVHRGSAADALTRRVNAKAVTHGSEIWLRSTETPTNVELMAHELAHTVQQSGPGSRQAHVPSLQRQTEATPKEPDPLTAPLTDSEWRSVESYLVQGMVVNEPLTGDTDHNAELIAADLFCQRMLFIPGSGHGEDPLLCVLPELTRADPRVQALKKQVAARGPLYYWPKVPLETRLSHVMALLVDTYHYPPNGAAGIVGNLFVESKVLPNRIEEGDENAPLRAPNAAGKMTDFTPDEVMNRSKTTGPRKPGGGLAQWSFAPHRPGLFQHTYQGRKLGSSILFNMDAQVDYLVSQLRAVAWLNNKLTANGVSLNDASDDFVYHFEVPRQILGPDNKPLPRSAAAVQHEFSVRRNHAQAALREYAKSLQQ